MNMTSPFQKFTSALLTLSLLTGSIAIPLRSSFAYDVAAMERYLRSNHIQTRVEGSEISVRVVGHDWVNLREVAYSDGNRRYLRYRNVEGSILIPLSKYPPPSPPQTPLSPIEFSYGPQPRAACMASYCQDFSGVNKPAPSVLGAIADNPLVGALMHSSFMMTDNPYTNAAFQSNRHVPASPATLQYLQDLNQNLQSSQATARTDDQVSTDSFNRTSEILGAMIQPAATVRPGPAPFPPLANVTEAIQESLHPLLDATEDGDPIAAAHAIAKIRSDIAKTRAVHGGRDDAKSDYLNRELNRQLLDSRGLLSGLQYAKSPEFAFKTAPLSEKGLRIRGSLNQLLATEEVAGFVCSDPKVSASEDARKSCSALSDQAQEIKTLHKVADRLASRGQDAAFKSLMEGLEKTTDTVSSFAQGFGSGSFEHAQAMVKGLAQLIAHPVDTAKGLFHAIQQYEETGRRIRAFTENKLSEIMSGDPEKIGAMTGALTVEIIAFMATGSASATGSAAIRTGEIASVAVKDAVLASAVELTADAAVTAGRITSEVARPLKLLVGELPEATFALVQKTQPIEKFIASVPSLSEESVAGLRRLDSIQMNFADSAFRESPEASLALGKQACLKLEVATEPVYVSEEIMGSIHAVPSGTSGPLEFTELNQAVETQVVASTGKSAGFYSSEEGRAAAEAWVSLSPETRTTLELTPGGRYLDKLDLFKNPSISTQQAKALWNRLSERYAEEAAGTAKFFISQDGLTRTASTFMDSELPALLKNPKIKKIETHIVKRKP